MLDHAYLNRWRWRCGREGSDDGQSRGGSGRSWVLILDEVGFEFEFEFEFELGFEEGR